MEPPTEPTSTGLTVYELPDQPTDTEIMLAAYDVQIRPVARSNRADWHVPSPVTSEALERTGFVPAVRLFIAEMDTEVDEYQHDPVATAQALARIEAILADLRYLRDRLHTVTALALREQQVRRLTVESVVTVEASSSIDRTNWQTPQLLALVLNHIKVRFVDWDTGEVLDPEAVGDRLGRYFRADWRLTALRELGIDPNDFCDVTRDDDGKPLSTPSVRIVDNRVRAQR